MRLSRPALYSALGSCLIHGLSLGFAATLIVSGAPTPPPSIKVTLIERAAPLPIAEGGAGKKLESNPVEKPPPPPAPKPVTKSRRASSPPKKVKPAPPAPPPRPEPRKVPKQAPKQTPSSAPVEDIGAVDEGTLESEEPSGKEKGPAIVGKASEGTADGGSGGEGRIAAQPNYGVNPKPPYPMLARRLGAQGIVLLRVHVRKDGTVAAVELARSSGFAVLDDAATRTVRERWRFVPARVDGVPVASWVEVPIRFILEGS